MITSDQQLLLQLLSENKKEMDLAFVACESMIKPYLHKKFPNDPEIADELSTKVVARAQKVGHKQKDDLKKMKGWLTKIAQFILLEYYKKRNLELATEAEFWKANDSALHPQEETTLMDIEAISDIIMEYLNTSCSETDKKIFLLRSIDDMPFKEIGKLFVPPISENTLIVKYSRIKKKIKFAIKNIYYDNSAPLS